MSYRLWAVTMRKVPIPCINGSGQCTGRGLVEDPEKVSYQACINGGGQQCTGRGFVEDLEEVSYQACINGGGQQCTGRGLVGPEEVAWVCRQHLIPLLNLGHLHPHLPILRRKRVN
jgi:hypothetical protein